MLRILFHNTCVKYRVPQNMEPTYCHAMAVLHCDTHFPVFHSYAVAGSMLSGASCIFKMFVHQLQASCIVIYVPWIKFQGMIDFQSSSGNSYFL